MTTTDTMNLDLLSESARCAVLTERLPKELRERGCRVTVATPSDSLTPWFFVATKINNRRYSEGRGNSFSSAFERSLDKHSRPWRPYL